MNTKSLKRDTSISQLRGIHLQNIETKDLIKQPSEALLELLEEVDYGFDDGCGDHYDEEIGFVNNDHESIYRVQTREDLEKRLNDNLTSLQKDLLDTIFRPVSDLALVGGAIRDTLLGQIPNDLDFYVSRRYLKEVIRVIEDRFEEIEWLTMDQYLLQFKVQDLEIDIMTGDEDFDMGCYADFSVNLLFYQPRAKFGLWTGVFPALNGTLVSSVNEVVDDIERKIARQIENVEDIGQERVEKLKQKGFKILDSES